MNKLKYQIPIIGQIIKDRDILLIERNNLLEIQNKTNIKKNPNFSKITKLYAQQITGVEKYLKGKKNIFDIGTGPIGSPWWQQIDHNATITGIDFYFFPEHLPKNVTIYKYDASKLDQIHKNISLPKYITNNSFRSEKIDLSNKFDLVVANHVLEHVENPTNLIKGATKLLKKNGIMYVGFPDYRNFTDIFYHLIHPNGGGHIQQLTNKSVEKMFTNNGFKLLECNIWPDDWLWFQSCYNPASFGIEHINQSQIDYLCNTFRKELTPNKGYFYGWEMIFKKTDD